jgi:ankyrin repeat protein
MDTVLVPVADSAVRTALKAWVDATEWRDALNGPNNESACLTLLRAGFDVNSHFWGGKTPIMEAAGQGQLGVCKLLLEWGAEVNHCDDDLATALHKAASNGYASVVDLLLTKGACVNATTRAAETPLHWGARHPAVIDALTAAGADVYALNEDGETPFAEAIAYDSVAACERLLAAGAHPMHRPEGHGNLYLTPLEKAIALGMGQMAEVLYRSCEADIYGLTAGGVRLVDLAGDGADATLRELMNSLRAQREVCDSVAGVSDESYGAQSRPSRDRGVEPM